MSQAAWVLLCAVQYRRYAPYFYKEESIRALATRIIAGDYYVQSR